MFEGSIIRTLRREAELLRQLQNSAAAIGIPSLMSKREPHIYTSFYYSHQSALARAPERERTRERECAHERARRRKSLSERVQETVREMTLCHAHT